MAESASPNPIHPFVKMARPKPGLSRRRERAQPAAPAQAVRHTAQDGMEEIWIHHWESTDKLVDVPEHLISHIVFRSRKFPTHCPQLVHMEWIWTLSGPFLPLVYLRNSIDIPMVKKSCVCWERSFYIFFRWGTLMVVIFRQFSSNWQHVFFYGWLCMGLQTSVLRHHLQGKMTVGKTVKKRSDVKLETNHRFL